MHSECMQGSPTGGHAEYRASHQHVRRSLSQEVVDEPWSRGKLAAHVAALAVSLAVLAAGAVAASRFTSAYWVQVRPHDSLCKHAALQCEVRDLTCRTSGHTMAATTMSAARSSTADLTSLMHAQLIFNTSPLMTALLASALLDAPPPLRLLPTLLLTIAGTGALTPRMCMVDGPFDGLSLRITNQHPANPALAHKQEVRSQRLEEPSCCPATAAWPAAA